MSKLREILRIRWALGLSVREAARSTRTSTGVVSKTVNRALESGLDWEMAELLSDAELANRVYGAERKHQRGRPEPDPTWIHRELRRSGVTLELLHLEYLEANPSGYRYTAFCDRYRQWLSRSSPTMRQVHKVGEKCFVDYSGKKPHIIDPSTGEVIEVELFVAVLGASNYTFAEATRTQKVADFIGSHIRAFEYFGGVSTMTVPDQLRSAVTKSCHYEPDIQRNYGEMGRHYGTAIVPARPRKPRDKAKVEVGVQVVQRWILACLRNESFFSLQELNVRIRELLERLNRRPMKRFGGVSRLDLFEEYEREALKPLPSTRFEVSDWRAAKVSPDYHIAVDKSFYSVPYLLCGERVEVRLTATTVEVLHVGKRVASHIRSSKPGRYMTQDKHMPPQHHHVFDAGEHLLKWAEGIGPMTHTYVCRIFDSNFHRQIGWRAAKGIQRLAGIHGPERLEKACKQALLLGGHRYKHVERILKLGRESAPLAEDSDCEHAPIQHENIRGPGYYH